ncbi:hypothetical protein BDA96_01G248000 [Sorghum bicolor]|uniref:Uncharacterized protein n=2 Tax=Sorghum bicolor TaxID=4558 RepID=A0A921S0U6_SORBI|nr:hypothetical protein BDA96_01G248000 [Sorghum bicolor]OQU91700.1 hypothetical protein SORBI_3001G233466 [Sorghum bicolor]
MECLRRARLFVELLDPTTVFKRAIQERVSAFATESKKKLCTKDGSMAYKFSLACCNCMLLLLFFCCPALLCYVFFFCI